MGREGIVFNIQKFSIHDGPGIRTAVFLKGCPLRCAWCANPESQSFGIQVIYDGTKCLHCGHCAAICPAGAVLVQEGGRVWVEHEKCTGCLRCVTECPGRALTGEGERKTVEEVVRICLQDRDFYEESGGGVTLSGGEAFASPEYAEALVRALKAEGIRTAAETTGHASPAVFRKLAPLFDLLLFDVKHADPEKHRAGTGVSNELIRANFLWAVSRGLNVLPRIPVIPGFNDGADDAEEIAGFLSGAGISRAQLLPFHQMGERKYEFLGRDYAMKGRKALHPEDLADNREIFLRHGVDAFF